MITDYILEISPYTSTSWTEVTSYQGDIMTHTLYVGTDSITSYERYRFRVRAKNDYGYSDYSEELPIAVAPLPS